MLSQRVDCHFRIDNSLPGRTHWYRMVQSVPTLIVYLQSSSHRPGPPARGRAPRGRGRGGARARRPRPTSSIAPCPASSPGSLRLEARRRSALWRARTRCTEGEKIVASEFGVETDRTRPESTSSSPKPPPAAPLRFGGGALCSPRRRDAALEKGAGGGEEKERARGATGRRAGTPTGDQINPEFIPLEALCLKVPHTNTSRARGALPEEPGEAPAPPRPRAGAGGVGVGPGSSRAERRRAQAEQVRPPTEPGALLRLAASARGPGALPAAESGRSVRCRTPSVTQSPSQTPFRRMCRAGEDSSLATDGR